MSNKHLACVDRRAKYISSALILKSVLNPNKLLLWVRISGISISVQWLLFLQYVRYKIAALLISIKLSLLLTVNHFLYDKYKCSYMNVYIYVLYIYIYIYIYICLYVCICERSCMISYFHFWYLKNFSQQKHNYGCAQGTKQMSVMHSCAHNDFCRWSPMSNIETSFT